MTMQQPALPRLMTAQDVARDTGIPLARVYELARDGDLPHVRLGRALRFDAEAVRRWLAAGGTGHAGPDPAASDGGDPAA